MGDLTEDVLENFEWTDDCQGKKDYDGEIVSLSTRYWPRGGGFAVFDSGTGRWQTSSEMAVVRPDIRPSAKSSIFMLGKEILSKKFEADTEEEVLAQVEDWARKHITNLKTVMEERSWVEVSGTYKDV